MSREVELGCVSWTSFASNCPSCSSTAVQRTLSLWLCPSTAVETAIVRCTSRWAMARGHRLNTSIVLTAVYGLSGLFRAVSEPSLCRPLPTLSPSLISHLASVDVKQQRRRPTQSSGAVWKSRWTSWAPVPNKPTVCVDVKQHFCQGWREPRRDQKKEVELGCQSQLDCLLRERASCGVHKLLCTGGVPTALTLFFDGGGFFFADGGWRSLRPLRYI